MKKSFKVLLLSFVTALALFSCSSNEQKQAVVVNNSSGVTMADGLDLKAVGEIVKTVKSAEEFEKELNRSGGINNLDLNEDKQVDYINVQEYGEGNVRAFSLTVNLDAGETQEIATIEVEKNGAQADVRLNGNQQIYGSTAHYHSRFSYSDYLLFSYMFNPHPYYYHRPYYPGYYPTYYSSYRSVPRSQYSNRVSTTYKTTTTTYKTTKTPTKSKVSSPNANKSSSVVKNRSLKQSTASQKNLQARDTKKDNKGGGFGTSKKTTTSKPAPKKTSSSTPKKSSSWGSSSKKSSSWGGSSRKSGGFRKSDARFKENIVLIADASDLLDQVHGYTYSWKVEEFPNEGFTEASQYGLIAQEVETISPTFVYTRPDGYKEVDYAAMVPVLVQALKDQQVQIEALNAKVDSLR